MTQNRAAKYREIAISEVRLGDRHRKDMGDLDGLARSIDRVGLLHPIGVGADGQLIYGERRLRAVRDILGWDRIPALVVDLDTLEAERDENEVRKDFTPSERVAIARAIAERVGERRGRPKKAEGDGDIVGNCPQLPVASGEKTRETAARAAGFDSDRTLRRAEKVVTDGTPELVEAMDAGEVSISAAAAVAELPAEEQPRVVEKVRRGKRPKQAVEEAKAKKSPPGEVDDWGIPIQPHAQEAFATTPEFKRLLGLLREVQKALTALVEGPGGKHLIKHCQFVKTNTKTGGKWVLSHLENAMRVIDSTRPRVTDCPYAFNEHLPHPENCSMCRNVRWTGELKGDHVPPTLARAMKRHYGVEEE